MEDLSRPARVVNSYQDWQADYAAHGVATFPVDADKRPMVSRLACSQKNRRRSSGL
jgi:hypothetical protein